MKALYLIICLWLPWVSCGLSFGLNFLSQPFVFEPAEAFAFVGDRLTFWLTLSDTEKYAMSNVYVLVTPQSERGFPFSVNVTSVNDTNGYVILEITEGIGGRTNLECHHGDGYVGGGAFVLVEKPLENITDVISVWYFFEKRLDISWQLNQEYFNLDNFEFSAVINPNQEPTENSSKCILKDSKNSCECKTSNGGFHYLRVTLQLRDRIKLNYNKSLPFNEVAKPASFWKSSLFEIVPMRQIKPDLREGLVTLNITSDTVTLSSAIPYGVSDYNFSLKYQMNLSNTEKEETIKAEGVIPESVYESSGLVLPFDHLKPATRYNASLKVKANESGHWSDISSIVFTTDEDRPDKAPPLLPTSIYVSQCHKTPTDPRGLRDVTFYWNKPDKEYTHGEVTKFGISFYDINDTLPKNSNHASHGTGIPCDITFEAELTSYTKVGRSRNTSKLIIPSEDDALKLSVDLDFKVMVVNNKSTMPHSVVISWTVTDLQEVKGIDIDDFKTFMVPLTRGSVIISNLDSKINRFAYALRKGSKVRPIEWMTCKYNPQNEPEKPTQVKTFKGKEPGSVDISWVSSKCTDQDLILILRNHVRICPRASKELCIHVVIEGRHNTSYTAKGLDTTQSYYVTVQSETAAGMGPESDPVEATPMEYSDDGAWKDKFIPIIVFIMLLFAAIPFVLLVRVYIHRQKKVDSEMKKIIMEPQAHHWRIMEKDSSLESGIFGCQSETTETSSQVSQSDRAQTSSQDEGKAQSMSEVSSSRNSSLQRGVEEAEGVPVLNTEPSTLSAPGISSSSPVSMANPFSPVSPVSPHAAVSDGCVDIPDLNDSFKNIHQKLNSPSASVDYLYCDVKMEKEDGQSPGNSLVFLPRPPISKENIETLEGKGNNSHPASATTSKSSGVEYMYCDIDLENENGGIHGNALTVLPRPPVSKENGETMQVKGNNPGNNVGFHTFHGSHLLPEGLDSFSHKENVINPLSKQHLSGNYFPTVNDQVKAPTVFTTEALNMKVKPVAFNGEVKPMGLTGEVGKPVGLSGQVKPVALSGQVKPVALSGQVKPVALSGQVKPVALSEEVKPVALSGQVKPVALSGQVKPVALSGQVKPVALSGQVKPVALSGQAKPVALSGQAKPVALSGQAKPVALSEEVKPVGLSGALKSSQDDRKTAEIPDHSQYWSLESFQNVFGIPSVGDPNDIPSIGSTSSGRNCLNGSERKISEDSGVVSPGAQLLEGNPFPLLGLPCPARTSAAPGIPLSSSFVKEDVICEQMNSDETKAGSSAMVCQEVPAQNQLGDSPEVIIQPRQTEVSPPGPPSLAEDFRFVPKAGSDYYQLDIKA